MQDLGNSQQMKLNLSEAPWMECECGGMSFEPGLMFKRISPIISPSGREEVVPVEIFKCKSCNQIPGFVGNKIPGIPEDMKAKKKTIIEG